MELHFDKLYIDGEFVNSHSKETYNVFSSIDEEFYAQIPMGSPDDVTGAVSAARRAFIDWSSRPIESRLEYLDRIREAIEKRSDEISEVITHEVGMPIGLSKKIQCGLALTDISETIQAARNVNLEERVGNSLIVREPIGVVGAITPWNYPLHQITAKLAPALAAGCCIVVKPASQAPISAIILAEIVNQIGLPPGVFNLIFGPGSEVGEEIVKSEDVDMISFTGSTNAGRAIGALAAKTVKRVTLELGGKSANIILDDADLDRAIGSALNACFLNSGQTCSALSRLLVPEKLVGEIEGRILAEIKKFVVGNPFEKGTRIGPLVSQVQQERVRRYIFSGIDDGAKLVLGGAEQPEGLSKGFYVKPTVFSKVTREMKIAQEEIFGPVLSILEYEDDEEAVELANETIYGLSGGVWSQDFDRALGLARKIRTGQVDINGGSFNPKAPFGGYKQSGSGRELGKYGLEEYFEIKAIQT